MKQPSNVLKDVFLDLLTLPSWQPLVMVSWNAGMGEMKIVMKTN